MTGGRVFTLLIACLLCVTPLLGSAQTLEELRKQVDDNAAQITALNKEIAAFEAQLKTTTTQKNTLQNKINQLDIQRKKLQSSVALTQKQISTTQAQISTLGVGIVETQSSIENNRAGLKESLRRMVESDSQPLALALLAAEDFTAAWEDADALAQLQAAVHDDIQELAAKKVALSETKSAAEEKAKLLAAQQKTLGAQQGSLNATRQTQAELLAQTKREESTYQTILEQKRAQQRAFEAALNDLSAKLNYTINPDQITKGAKGILHYPIDNVRVTQYFGNTAFALAGAYNGKGHNGIDFAAPVGTPLKAALAGTVLGTGNTDSVKGCFSFGKWVMIKHSNGLNTMYAHLSQITVSQGQTVGTGEVIGYSGETGYATGPHLHFGVYVSSATQIITLGSATNSTSACSKAVMPIVPVSGYLNPMSYL
jgi:murein DD-endopeptidase MepM/ murein hydrolase activator NlpD